MSILVKNCLNKILVIFVVLLLIFSNLSYAKESYSSLYIKITDATTLVKNKKTNEAKILVEELKKEFSNFSNTDSEAGKKVSEALSMTEVTQENLTKASSALLDFEKEQNPIDVSSEKLNFKNKMYPALEKLEKSIDEKNVENMKAEYVKYNSTWVRNESLVRTLDSAYYGKIENSMSFLRASMEVEPFNYENTKKIYLDLKAQLNDFLSGKTIEKSTDIQTLEEGVKILQESYDAFVSSDYSIGQEKMKRFIESWPVFEGEVRTRNSSLYTRVESETPIIMVKGNEVNYQEQLKNLIEELSKINTQSDYTFIDAMLILLREGVEALVIVLSLASAVRAAKQKKALKWIYGGAVVGILSSIAAAIVLQMAFPALAAGTNREIIEGIVGIIAVVMMLGIGFWLHSKSSLKAWKNYMDKQLNVVLSTGSFISMFFLSFLAVFREGAETILFYVGIIPKITIQSLALGIAMAILGLVIIAILLLKASSKLPINKVFLVLSWLIYLLAFKMLGVSLHALELTNIISATIVDGVPTVDLLGIYPSWEIIGSQLFFIILLLIFNYIQSKREK